MKRINYLIILAIVLVSLHLVYSAPLKPDNFVKKVYLETPEKNYIYYSFSNKKPLEIEIKGPQRLKIYLRGSQNCNNIEYQILIDNNVFQTGDLKEKYSKYKIRDKELRITQAKTFTVRIPSGKHSFSIKPGKSCQLYARIIELDEELVLFAPTKSHQTLNLVVREKEYDYYLCSKKEPVEVSVIGPTTLTVYARLNFTKEMSGSQHFTIINKEDGETNHNYKLETSISEVSYYKEEKGLVPSKAEKFEIKVGKGARNLKFYLGDSAANTAALRFYVPKSALNK